MNNGSAQAYAAGNANGLLDGARREVYDYIRDNGPVTAKDVLKALAPQGKSTSTFTARFSELADGGMIKESGTLGAHGVVWTVAENQPTTKIELRERRRQAKVARIRSRIASLQKQLATLETT